jgi:hypothetical protein
MSAVVLRGGCRCGALAVEATLTSPASAYTPRACDCSFCRERDAAWLSDPDGVLRLVQRDGSDALHCRQGSGQADFIACAHCGTLVMVACEIDGNLYAAINAQVLQGAAFAPEQPASPQQLSADAKRERWRRLWFAEVRIESRED